MLLISLSPTNIQSASATHQQICVTATLKGGEELSAECNVIDEEEPIWELSFCSVFPKVDRYSWLAPAETWVKQQTYKGVTDKQRCPSTKKLKKYVYEVNGALILVNDELQDTHQLRQYGNKKYKSENIDIKLIVRDSQ
jgi:hypothetical protein